MVVCEKKEVGSRSEAQVPAPITATGIHLHVFLSHPVGTPDVDLTHPDGSCGQSFLCEV